MESIFKVLVVVIKGCSAKSSKSVEGKLIFFSLMKPTIIVKSEIGDCLESGKGVRIRKNSCSCFIKILLLYPWESKSGKTEKKNFKP